MNSLNNGYGLAFIVAGATALLWWCWRVGALVPVVDGGVDATGEANDGITGDDIYSAVEGGIVSAFALWRAPVKYAAQIHAAEQINGLPDGLLERLLYQESRYREDVITGVTNSPVGAQGIAQFMPATARAYGVNPLDAGESIAAAGRMLADLYRQFGNWQEALAAYNWGSGNVSRKGLGRAPKETRNYYAAIMNDAGVA